MSKGHNNPPVTGRVTLSAPGLADVTGKIVNETTTTITIESRQGRSQVNIPIPKAQIRFISTDVNSGLSTVFYDGMVQMLNHKGILTYGEGDVVTVEYESRGKTHAVRIYSGVGREIVEDKDPDEVAPAAKAGTTKARPTAAAAPKGKPTPTPTRKPVARTAA
jgi:RNase P/RNase MRP subunit p29